VFSDATTSPLVCFVQLFIRYVAVRCLYVCVCVRVCLCVPDVFVCGMSGCELLVLNKLNITACTVRK
jgi:hypothetical protein